MKNNGFASVYALLFLELIITFCITVITAAAALAQSDPQAPLFEAQLFAIYHVKAQMKAVNEPPMDEEDAMTDDASNAVPDESTTTDGFSIPSESLVYEGIPIDIQYEADVAWITLGDVQIKIQCDLTEKRIIDLVYLSQ